jgi:hypothetical protein
MSSFHRKRRNTFTHEEDFRFTLSLSLPSALHSAGLSARLGIGHTFLQEQDVNSGTVVSAIRGSLCPERFTYTDYLPSLSLLSKFKS